MKNYFTTNKGKAIFLIEKGYELLGIEKSEKGKLKLYSNCRTKRKDY